MPSPEVRVKIDAAFSSYPVRSYPRGQILIFGDEDPEHIFYLVKGRVRVYDVSYRGDEIIVNTFKATSFFPMSYALNKTPNRYFYKTEVKTDVHLVPIDVAEAFLKDNPDVLYDLLKRVYRGMDGLLGRMVQLMSGTARSRLVYELIIECRRFGAVESESSYTLESSEVDLASRSGLSRETVSREMQKLKSVGIVTITNSGIAVTDIHALRKIIGEEL